MEKQNLEKYIKKLETQQETLYEQARTCQTCGKKLKGDDDVIVGHPTPLESVTKFKQMVIPIRVGEKTIVGLVTSDEKVVTVFCSEECAKKNRNPLFSYKNFIEV